MVYNLTPMSVPSGLCSSITTLQQWINAIAQYLTVTLPDWVTNVVKATVPPSDIDATWVPIDANGLPTQPGYSTFAAGSWVAKHPLLPGTITIWTGSVATLSTYDGGDANPIVSPTSGAMWEVASEFAARIPIGVGTLPSTTAVAVTGTDGAEKVTLTTDQLPAHTHTVTAHRNCDIDETSNRTLAGQDGDTGEFADSMNTGSTGGAQSHDNMPPYIGVYFIKRTDRTHYKLG